VNLSDTVKEGPPDHVDAREAVGFERLQSIGVTDDVAADSSGVDTDGDGVGDSVENSAPNSGDGNDDDIADYLQADVSSLPDASGVDYVTVVVEGGCTALLDVAALEELAMPAQDAACSYPFGLLEFRLACSTATITLIFHAVPSLEGPYRNYGPTVPGAPATSDWYTLPTATFGTTTITGIPVASVILGLTDGALGDDTGADGQITGRGGPATAAPALPMLSPIGVLVLTTGIGAAAFTLLLRVRFHPGHSFV
jgi:hypothetical protein